MSNEEIILGIDLGTTFSASAYVDEQGWPRVIPNAEGEMTTPSVVLIENNTIEVGTVAANQAKTKRDNVIQWIKRAMGDNDYRFQGMGPVEISAEILKKIKKDAEQELGCILDKAVITCPAYFAAVEVENTKKAGELAGLEVKEIVREPTAAAVYYGVENLKDGCKLMVCDLGGGTYDTSILALEDGTFKPLATAGDRQMGGHDWTSDLMGHAADLLRETLGFDPRNDPAVEQALYDTCERVKRDFARCPQGIIPCVCSGKNARVTVTREQFETLTEWRIQQMLTWTGKALEKASPPLTWEQIHHILLVGGATRMRRVAEALAERSGKKPLQTAEADTMVALGAAILAKGSFRPRRMANGSGIKKNIVSGLTIINFTRTAPRNLGTRVIVRGQPGMDIENSIIIPYGTEIPAEKIREDYQTSLDNQEFFDIPVVEFDDVGPDVIQDTLRFKCPSGLPRGTAIQVTFKYDRSGQIEVTAVEQHSGKTMDKERVTYEEPDLETISKMSPPRSVVFTLDISGSMYSRGKIERAKQAVIDNSRQLLGNGGGQVRIGVVAFGSRAETVCPLTDDIKKITTSVSRLSPYGSTAMGEGIVLALELLREPGNHKLREIVLVSDGMPDSTEKALEAGAKAGQRGVNLSSLGIGHEDIDEAFLKDISPNYLVIENAEGIHQAMSTLLTLSGQPAVPQAGITWLGGSK
jgi:molecular chaperone DnaK